MLEWIEITEEEYEEYQDEAVLAVNSSRSSIIGYIVQDARYNGFICEGNGGGYITDITHFIPTQVIIEELLKTLPTKKEE